MQAALDGWPGVCFDERSIPWPNDGPRSVGGSDMQMMIFMIAGGKAASPVRPWAEAEDALRRSQGAARFRRGLMQRARADSWPARLGDAVLLASVLILAAAALAAAAVAAPLILAASALAGLVLRNGAPGKAWRAARAR